MQRSRLLVAAVCAAAFLAPLGAAPAAAAAPTAPAAALLPVAFAWQPLGALRDWLRGFWPDEGCSHDPMGGCLPGTSPSATRQARPVSASRALRSRPDTGGRHDAMGHRTPPPPAPARGSQVNGGATRDPNGG